MLFWATTSATKTAGPLIQINCPFCRTLVIAETEDYRETLKLLHLIPVLKKTTTFVRCTKCRRELVANKPADELRRMPPTGPHAASTPVRLSRPSFSPSPPVLPASCR